MDVHAALYPAEHRIRHDTDDASIVYCLQCFQNALTPIAAAHPAGKATFSGLNMAKGDPAFGTSPLQIFKEVPGKTRAAGRLTTRSTRRT